MKRSERSRIPKRFRSLERRRVLGRWVPVAGSPLSRLLGLALLDPARAGEGLLLPRCRAVHTVGMRFALELVFLDSEGRVIRRLERVGPRRFRWARRATAVLELPALAASRGDSGEREARDAA